MPTADDSDNPGLDEAIESHIEAFQDRLFTSLPAKVVRYDEGLQAVDAQPLLRIAVRSTGGVVRHDRLPVVLNAPVLFQGSGANRLTMPVTVGSTVLLFFPSAALDRWLGTGVEIDTAGDDSKHTLQAAFALLGGHSFNGQAKPPTMAPQDAVVMHTAPAVKIKLGSQYASDNVVGKSVLEELKDIITHAAAGGPGDGFGARLAEQLADWPLCQSKVKIPEP